MKKLLLATTLLITPAAAQDLRQYSVPYSGGPGTVGWLQVGPCAPGQAIGWATTNSPPVCVTGGSGGGGGITTFVPTAPITGSITGTQLTTGIALDHNFAVVGGGLGFANIASGHLLANPTVSNAEPTDTSVSALFDQAFGAVNGSIIQRNGSWIVNQVSGDGTLSPSGVLAVTRVNGVTFPAAAPSLGTVPVITSASTVSWQTIPNTSLQNSTVTLNSGAGLTAPGAMSLGGTYSFGATSDIPQFAGVKLTGAIRPVTDSTAAVVIGNAAATNSIVRVDTTNSRVGINKVPGAFDFDTAGPVNVGSTLTFGTLSPLSLGTSTSTITGLTANNTPSSSNDYFLYYSASDNAIRKCTLGACSAAGASGVTSLNGLTGGLNITAGTGISIATPGGGAIQITNTGGGGGGVGTIVGTAPITASGTSTVTMGINLDANFGVVANNLALATIPAGQVIANSTAITAEPIATTVSALLDRGIGSTNAAVLQRGAAGWAANVLSGDVTLTNSGVATVAKVNGVAYPATPTTNTVPVVTGVNTVTYQTIPNASLTNSSITLNAGAGVGLSTPGAMSLGSTYTIGATTDVPRFAGLTLTGNLKPQADSTTGVTVSNAAGTSQIVRVDTTNNRVGINKTPGAFDLDVNGAGNVGGALTFGTGTITGLSTAAGGVATGTDYMLYYSATDNAIRKCLISGCGTGGGGGNIAQINGQTGPNITISAGLGMTVGSGGTNNIQISQQAVLQPTTTRLTTGTNLTYNPPAGVTRIEVMMVGGGAGGGGSGGTSWTTGGSGGTTCWGLTSPACNSPIYAAGGGSGGNAGSGPGAVGGTVSGTGTCTDSANGSGAGANNGAAGGGSQVGGVSLRGGAAAGAYTGTGFNAAPNSGSGGTGGGSNGVTSVFQGISGASGAWCFAVINSPAASYVYTVGAGGNAGAAGAGGGAAGGTGGSGVIIVREYYGIGTGAGLTGAVTSLNGQQGDIVINPGSGISVNQIGNAITVTNTVAGATVFTTGDVKLSIKKVSDPGWVIMNDGTLGSSATSATAYAGDDAHDLFVLLWNNIPNALCPVTPGGRGASAENDWTANKVIRLPLVLGRALASAGTGGGLSAHALGSAAGAELTNVSATGNYSGTVSGTATGSHTLTIAEMPQHTHSTNPIYPWELLWYYAGGGGGGNNADFTPGVGNDTISGGPAGYYNVGYEGGNNAFSLSASFSAPYSGSVTVSSSNVSILSPHSYLTVMIKL